MPDDIERFEGGISQHRVWADGREEFRFCCNECSFTSDSLTSQDAVTGVAMEHFEKDHVGLSYGGFIAQEGEQ